MEEEIGMFSLYRFNVSSMMGIYIYQYKGFTESDKNRNLGHTITKFDSESQTLVVFFYSFIKRNFYAVINSESLLM